MAGRQSSSLAPWHCCISPRLTVTAELFERSFSNLLDRYWMTYPVCSKLKLSQRLDSGNQVMANVSSNYVYQDFTKLCPGQVDADILCLVAASSWLGEFQRLYDTIPCVQVATLKEHRDQVLHVSFSHNGYFFSSCSKDCFVKVRMHLLCESCLSPFERPFPIDWSWLHLFHLPTVYD